MSGEPYNSPWGEVQHCEKMIEGVFLVSTAGHGGIMVRGNASGFLSDYAQSAALRGRHYLCFEEDCDEQIVLRELLDRKLWHLPDSIIDKSGYEEAVNRSLKRWHPDYWDARQKRLPMAERLRDGAGRAAEYNLSDKNEAAHHGGNLEAR